MNVSHPVTLPRVLIAAPASGHGKTTVATGLMAALRAEGDVVSPHKVGPDYIDPGFHTLAAGRPGRNLDLHLCGEDRIVPLLLHGAFTPEPADIAVIEGVMGLFDGQLGTDGFASSAHIARLTKTPVVLVVDVSHTSRSVGALVTGMVNWDPTIDVAGVILNQAGSDRHEAEVRAALGDVPVFGSVRRDKTITRPSRHLGLVPAEETETSEAFVAELAERIAASVDLAAIRNVANSAAVLDGERWRPDAVVTAPSPETPRPVVAVAGGRAFTFRYAETVELLTAGGCDVVEFDPLCDTQLPENTAGLYIGGGFPEVHATELAENTSLAASVQEAVAAGVPTVAECAGLLYLGREVNGTAMAGALPHTSAMQTRLTMGYRTATAPSDTLLAVAGETVSGHEFHRTHVTNRDGGATWTWPDVRNPGEFVNDGVSVDPGGTGQPSVHASYLHLHWAGTPLLAQRFIDRVHRFAARGWTPRNQPTLSVQVEPDLWHHGDADVRPGTVDFAVNVHPDGPPAWLTRSITDVDVTVYPDAKPAKTALSTRHGLDPSCVLPTAGAAEAFTLLARAWRDRTWCVVHPQFTEPEAALRVAGATVYRHVLRSSEGFTVNADRLIQSAKANGCDVVVIGNPTNPTGVTHPREALQRVIDAGLTLVVDEAFLDAAPGTTMLGSDAVVIRSLTKLWSIPGVRAGWVSGPADVIGQLSRFQPPWSVSAAAIASMVAVCADRADDERGRRVATIAVNGQDLRDRLVAVSCPVTGSLHAPFVLVDTGLVRSPVERFAEQGFSVRRGESFPGLGPGWVRLAVRTPELHGQVVAVLRRILDDAAPLG